MANRTPANETLFRCWNNGWSIRATMQNVRKVAGVDLSFEQVRRAFVDMAERFG